MTTVSPAARLVQPMGSSVLLIILIVTLGFFNQYRLRLRTHFYTDWQLLLLLRFALLCWNDWCDQCCACSNSNANSYGDSNTYRYA